MSYPCDPRDCSPPGSSVHAIFSRQEYWSGLPFPSAEALPDPGVRPEPPALHADSSLLSPCGCVLNALVGPLSLRLHPLTVSLLLYIPDYSFFSFSSKYFLLSFNLEDSVHIVSLFWNVLCPLIAQVNLYLSNSSVTLHVLFPPEWFSDFLN